jgi:hypothetical protein
MSTVNAFFSTRYFAGSENWLRTFDSSTIVYPEVVPLYEAELDAFTQGTSLAGIAASAEPVSVSSTSVIWGNSTNGVRIDWRLQNVSSLDDLETAITSGTENGTIQSIRIFDAGREIAGAYFRTNGYSFISGNLSFNIVGALPTGLSDIFQLVDALNSMSLLLNGETTSDGVTPIDRDAVVTALRGYDFDGINITNGSQTLLEISTTSTGGVIRIADFEFISVGDFPNTSLADSFEFSEALLASQDFFGAGLNSYSPGNLSDNERDSIIEKLNGVSYDSFLLTYQDETLFNFTLSASGYRLEVLGAVFEIEGSFNLNSLGELMSVVRAYQEADFTGDSSILTEAIQTYAPELTLIRLTDHAGNKLLELSGSIDLSQTDAIVPGAISVLGTSSSDFLDLGRVLGSSRADSVDISLGAGADRQLIDLYDVQYALEDIGALVYNYGTGSYELFNPQETFDTQLAIDAGEGTDELQLSDIWGSSGLGENLHIDLSSNLLSLQLPSNNLALDSVSAEVSGFEKITLDLFSENQNIVVAGTNISESYKVNQLTTNYWSTITRNITIDGGDGWDTLDLSTQKGTSSWYWDGEQYFSYNDTAYTMAQFQSEFEYLGVNDSGAAELFSSTYGSVTLELSNVEYIQFSDTTTHIDSIFGQELSNTVYHWAEHSVIDEAMISAEGKVTRMLTDDDTGRAISASDALAALKIAVGLNPNSEGLSVSPYQMLAADVNKDGRVSAADALSILKMAVGLDGAPNRDWILCDERAALWNDESNEMAFTRNSVDWSLVGNEHAKTDASIKLVGVLAGDVNGSWTNSELAQVLDTAYFEDLALSTGVSADQWWV